MTSPGWDGQAVYIVHFAVDGNSRHPDNPDLFRAACTPEWTRNPDANHADPTRMIPCPTCMTAYRTTTQPPVTWESLLDTEVAEAIETNGYETVTNLLTRIDVIRQDIDIVHQRIQRGYFRTNPLPPAPPPTRLTNHNQPN